MSHGSSDKCEPNFTPLLDLVLQLVMFFMLCANFVMDQTSVEVKLPKAIAAQPLSSDDKYTIFLNVNAQGKVILSSLDQYKDSQGTVTSTLDNAEQVRQFLLRRAKEDRAAAGVGENVPPRSVIILRVDQKCSFKDSYPIMKACRSAGYMNVRLRAERSNEG